MKSREIDSIYKEIFKKDEKELVLNIAAICPSTKSLGPGKRFAIWMQGCCFNCYNCSSPEWREMKEEILITPYALAQKILQTPEIEGITISGGEPILQATGLLFLIKIIRKKKPLTVILYTGFTLEELRTQKRKDIDSLLSEVDVLIDGPYIDKLNDNKGLRGSSNQKIHFLSGKYKEYENEFLNAKRNIEIYLYDDHYLLVGIKPREYKTLLNI